MQNSDIYVMLSMIFIVVPLSNGLSYNQLAEYLIKAMPSNWGCKMTRTVPLG